MGQRLDVDKALFDMSFAIISCCQLGKFWRRPAAKMRALFKMLRRNTGNHIYTMTKHRHRPDICISELSRGIPVPPTPATANSTLLSSR